MTDARNGWRRPGAILLGLLVAYFAFPAHLDDSIAYLTVSLVLSAVGLGVVAWMMVLELQHVRAGVAIRTVRFLSMMLVLLVMASSLAFYLLDVLSPDQFVGLDTRMDALYFTLSTMTTVGYGDVHAEGQVARALVCALIVFNIVVVASLVRVHTRQGPSSP